MTRRNNLEKFLGYLLIFLAPTQLAYHFWPTSAYVFGIRVDYLAPSIYLTDILAVLLLVVAYLNHTKIIWQAIRKYKKYLLIFLLVILSNCYFSESTNTTLYRWIKIIEFSALIFYISKIKTLKTLEIQHLLIYSAVLFSIIAIIQFVVSGTVGGLLYYLGERSFNLSTPGIALVSLGGREFLRAYSTFSHPNSLAGYLSVILILYFANRSKLPLPFVPLIIFIMVAALCLTFSLTAYTGLVVCIFFIHVYLRKKYVSGFIIGFLYLSVIISFVMAFYALSLINNYPGLKENMTERLELANLALILIRQKIFTGVGLGAFIASAAALNISNVYRWLLQPVHNIVLLIAAETGAIGMLGYILFVRKLIISAIVKRRNYIAVILVFVIFTGLGDHYWLTLQQNILLLSLLSGLALR